jgi:cell wall assembly regulator SMI1
MHNGHSYPNGGGGGVQPPLSHTWARLRTWLAREYPELGDTLNYGITALDLQMLEMQLGGLELPQAVRDSYLCTDGQEPESASACAAGLFFGLMFLPLEDVMEEWKFWREVDDDPQTGANPRLRTQMGSVPPGFVRREYSSKGWIPLAADKAGNYLGVDVNPDEKGAVGQVIVFGRDIDTKVVLWRGDGPDGWARWLASFVDELESGEGYEFAGATKEGNSEDEDDIGYGGYYYDGAAAGQGDSGGDGGGGGLRLAGEYRGWDVLQAWADRSIRRWQAAGAYPDTSILSSGTSKVINKSMNYLTKKEPDSFVSCFIAPGEGRTRRRRLFRGREHGFELDIANCHEAAYRRYTSSLSHAFLAGHR